jgi:dephospho-CoA kinase
MKIFVIVGMPAAGKNIARSYAESKNMPYFATGDIVRAEVRRRGLEPNAENTADVSNEMRGSDGMGVTRRALQTAKEANSRVVFLEGMRSWPEIELIRQGADCTVVAFIAPRQTRRDRVLSRGRSDDAPHAFDARDEREIAYGAAVPIALADAYVLNTSAMQDAVAALDEIVEGYLKK